MANNTITLPGKYKTCLAAASVADGVFSTGAVSIIGSAIMTEKAYPLLDFKCTITLGTPTTTGAIDLYRRSGDGNKKADIPAIDYLFDYIGSFTLPATANAIVYLFSVENTDSNDSYHAINNNGVTLNFEIAVRGNTFGI